MDHEMTMIEKKEQPMLYRLTKVIGDSYDGHADPKDTPNNWARAEDVAKEVLTELLEPTDKMIEASECECGTFYHDDNHVAYVTRDYQAMIKAAQEEKE